MINQLNTWLLWFILFFIFICLLTWTDLNEIDTHIIIDLYKRHPKVVVVLFLILSWCFSQYTMVLYEAMVHANLVGIKILFGLSALQWLFEIGGLWHPLIFNKQPINFINTNKRMILYKIYFVMIIALTAYAELNQ